MIGWDEFDIYKNTNDSLHSDYVYPYSLPFEKVHDKFGWTMLFQKYWHHSITVSIVYYIVIRAIQYAMKNREAFQLQRALFYWNSSLALFSVIGCVRFAEDFLATWKQFGLTHSLCHSCNPDGVAAFWSLAFAISKFVELGDTLFIVLRKKPLIFLHYYHHVAVLVYTIHSGWQIKLETSVLNNSILCAEHTAPGQAFITMNYFAHAFMYSYYAFMATGKRAPRWVSMGVTTIQTTQMFAGVAVSCYIYYIKVYTNIACQQSMANLYLAFLIYITFAVLFVQFFVNAYFTDKKPKKTKTQ
ncbi:Elongation of very long chain fatty acids protein [Aphelenchoides bicaudatus]|nr:Elongation of very long chain fatty acids protein [Aphelenchoides bicaudatus]